jgi:HlyD family secretion protein
MKKAIITLVLLGAIGGSVYAYYNYRNRPQPPTVLTAVVTRGDITDTVGATGTLQAVTTVQVGTQVSGTIQELYADFNSLVRKGQVLARLDPSLFHTQIEQARANLIRAQADLERLKVTLDDARTKLTRAQELWQRQLIPQSELEAAQVAVRSAEAQLRSSQAQVTQAEASLNQNEVNLAHTVISAPIDGLVVSRNVDVGQTVAASMQAPTLFVLAADLSKMQVVANLDESDVGRIRPGQPVLFRVDAYPAEDFTGTVSQVRLQPQVVQNVVTYATVIDVPNPQLKLKPGMTANVNVEIARRSNVLRVPNTALRFRPTNEIFAALGQTPPAPEQLVRRTAAPPTDAVAAPPPMSPAGQVSAPTGRPESGDSPAPRAGGNAPAGTEALPSLPEAAAPAVRGAARAADGPAGGRFMERLQEMSPEQRERALARMAARGVNPSAAGGASAPGAAGRGDAPSSEASGAQPGATTIDALFGPLPAVESIGRVWTNQNGKLVPVRVRLGITDGQATELIEGDLEEGQELVTAVNAGSETRPAANAIGGFPFMGQPTIRFQGGPPTGGGGRGSGR